MSCIVCGQENCQEQVITGMTTKRKAGDLPRKPIQAKTLGVPGYNKPVKLYHPDYPHINFVGDEPEEEVETVVKEVVEVTRRVRTVEDVNAVARHDPEDS